MKITKRFSLVSNLEFTASLNQRKITNKILYRSENDIHVFKQSIYTHFSSQDLSTGTFEKIHKIFSLDIVKNLTFHFGEDPTTGRVKFYISLYNIPLEKSLSILSEIKKVLGIQEYSLEKDFLYFDCIGFDIRYDRIDMKVYEIISGVEYHSLILDSIPISHIKEIGVLKSLRRKKVFFRLSIPMDIHLFPEIYDSYVGFKKAMKGVYDIQGRVTYYCKEKDRTELYFI